MAPTHPDDPHLVCKEYCAAQRKGEPDVVGQDEKTGEYIFCDCSAESPQGRRSVCYDREGKD
ncbi:MAG TPA: DUF4256 domain-containing protein, partial [Burkholderiaceae bacterium]|nr:DUF4256 domain-containing protein [Burkholderiaceae bacterium]